MLAYFGGSLYYITCVWRGITRHTSEAGCSSGGRTLDWGSRGRRFKSCHSDFRRSSVVGTSFFVRTMTGRSVPKHSVIIEVGSINLIGQRYRTAHLNERSRLLFHNPAQIKKQRKTGNRRPLSLSHEGSPDEVAGFFVATLLRMTDYFSQPPDPPPAGLPASGWSARS